jgi:hypothetical protein
MRPGENLVWLCDTANDDIIVVLVEGIHASLWCRALFRSKVSKVKIYFRYWEDDGAIFHMVTLMEASSTLHENKKTFIGVRKVDES